VAAAQAKQRAPSPTGISLSVVAYSLRLLAIGIVSVFSFWLAVQVGRDGNLFLAFALVLIAVGVGAINLIPGLWPLRWMSPGLALMALLAIYPLIYTVYIAFTNYSDGHLYTKERAVQLMSNAQYLPAESVSYSWELYGNDEGTFALWLTTEEGATFFAAPGQPLATVTLNQSGEAPYDKDGLPATFNGFRQLSGKERLQAMRDANLQTIQFGDPANPIGITSRSSAGNYQQKWVYDAEQDAVVDKETNVIYKADVSVGEFVAADGSHAPLGFWVQVGVENFTRIFTSVSIREPLLRVFGWTIAFAFFSVLTAFSLGLFMALMLDKFPGARFIKSLLIIPYAVPGMISILIWRGMLNPNGGVITSSLNGLLGWAPPWHTDPGWAKVAVLLVNLWLAFPYFMLICTGALQSISSAIYEAAEVDGANAWQRFWSLTLPLLLVAVGPLLIASFTYNFNNFLLIEALFGGGPPMVGTSAPPVGHTDNLISYTYRYAFSSGGSREYGFASAIAIVIFFMVGGLTLFQFRFTKRWEEVGDNV
jgi:ABC-type sugar transport system permease subunit